ncbi:MAG: hypothetical protein JO184_13105 [Gammaproteobacteria bacterium]|nr:hypothetical protein [Gammaproteobacteria bacterium]MBV8306766.1 hypothetical protein [Gammaproteobacteria bacterium]MBV8404007.1 hypothetical protein [Gammaproteobacteria bacterium]
MKRPKSLLVVIERTASTPTHLAKALVLARALPAQVELFLCDSEQAYVLGHAYDRDGVLKARAASLTEARRYLGELRDTSGARDVEMAIDAECESPLYESIVRKVLRSAPDIVVKAIAADAHKPAMPDPNDWQLVRTCPVTVILTRSRTWRTPPRLAAAIDVSDAEPEEFARSVMEAGVLLAEVVRAELHIVYGERGPEAGARERLAKLQRLCAEAGIGHDRTHVVPGVPEQSLPRFVAAQGYDALVLGALAHRAAGTTPVGTLTSTLLDSLECDFVLVKPSGYSGPPSPSER